MSINDLFIKGNKLFSEKNFFDGLDVFKKIWFQHPKNKRLEEEIRKKIKKFKKPINQTHSKKEIENFFNLEKLGKSSTVIRKLTNTIEKNQNDILTISLLATFWSLKGNYNKAIYFHRLAIQKQPLESAFYLNLSDTLIKINKLEDALNVLHYAKVLSLNEKNIDYKIAKLLTDLKKFSKSNQVYEELINSKNISKEIIYSYCDNLIKFKKEDDVILFIKKYEKANGTDSNLKSILGLAYFQKKQYDLAKSFYNQSIDINDKNCDTYTLLGDNYLAVDDFNNAKFNYNKSLQIKSNNKMALNNLASLYYFKGNVKEAEKIYELSLKFNKNNYDGYYNLAQCQLAQANFTDGWINYKYRWFASQFNSPKLNINVPKFNLKKEKKNLLIWSEQGVGDQILFLRFLKDLEPYVNNLFIKIDSRLHQIIVRLYPKIKFLVKQNDNKNEVIDYQIPIGNLGELFVKDTSYLFKNSTSYLTSDYIITNELKNIFQTRKKFICGLSWISKNEDIGDKKSISLEILKPILSIKNIEFLDLQYSNTNVERDRFFKNSGIKINKIEKIDNYNDLNGITSLIDICDFVITVSNTNAHLSGALGKETFLLLPKGKGKLWYWSSHKDKCYWYNSIQIIEQKTINSWNYPIKKLKKIIKERTNE